MHLVEEIIAQLKRHASPEKAALLGRFFKTGIGEYAEGDTFHGVVVPEQRKIANAYWKEADTTTIETLLHSGYHEERLTGLLILNKKFLESKKTGHEQIWVDLYLNNLDCVNNWDLVDSTAHIILGQWLTHRDRSLLYELAQSPSIWRNRVAVIAAGSFIRNRDYTDLLQLCQMMLTHKHDLIHKATGWMLREVWKKDPAVAEAFLETYKSTMPRTMLRYAIEKMPEVQRKEFLSKT